jgi:hypothetical protein
MIDLKLHMGSSSNKAVATQWCQQYECDYFVTLPKTAMLAMSHMHLTLAQRALVLACIAVRFPGKSTATTHPELMAQYSGVPADQVLAELDALGVEVRVRDEAAITINLGALLGRLEAARMDLFDGLAPAVTNAAAPTPIGSSAKKMPTCNRCGKAIVWTITSLNHKLLPVAAEGFAAAKHDPETGLAVFDSSTMTNHLSVCARASASKADPFRSLGIRGSTAI